MKYIFLFIILAIRLRSEAQIVNIENLRIVTDTTGWAGYIRLGITASKEVNSVVNILSDVQAQYKTKNDLYLIRGNTNFSRSGGTTFTENTFIHLRYNRKLSPWLRWEVFTQWQHNKITGINNRYLAGTGPRIKLMERKTFHSYFGTSIMYESEEETQIEGEFKTHNVVRSSNYLSLSYQPLPNIKLTSTAYFQPLPDLHNDYRFFMQSTLGMDITKKISFEFGYRYLYDSTPAPGIPNTTYAVENYLKWKF